MEVKYRGKETMSPLDCLEALKQAQSLTTLLVQLRQRGETTDLTIWRLASQHFLVSMLSYGFRVYSQQDLAAKQPKEWSSFHQRVVGAIFSEEVVLEIDPVGRLIVMDGSPGSGPRDNDQDGFHETIVLSASDAASIVAGSPGELYAAIRKKLSKWELMPAAAAVAADMTQEGESRPLSQGRSDSEADAKEASEGPSSLPAVLARAAGTDRVDEGAATLPKPSPEVAVPSKAPTQGIQIVVGDTADSFRPHIRMLNISDTNLNQLNMGVVGDLGTGKTQLVKSLVYQVATAQDRNQGIRPRFLIFDYKKDYGADDFVKAVGAKVIQPKNLPINLFDVSGAAESTTPWMDRYKFFADVLVKIFPNVGAVQHALLKQSVKDSYQHASAMGRQPTIYDVHGRYKALLGNKIDGPFAVLDDIVDMELFASDPKACGDFGKFFSGTVVVALNALGQDDRTKNMLVAIMLNMFYEHILRIPKRPYLGSDPQLRVVDSFLLVDEADNIMRYEFDVLRKILLQGREFGVGVILASQYLRHFKAGATDYREPLLTWFIHKVPNLLPQELGALGITAGLADLAENVKGLAKHECLYKCHDVGGEIIRGKPFYKLIEEGGGIG
ncbi:MAG: hypothetical protein IPG75_15275 [Gemmatimonadetes bacterium]|nr:hypothetical protein [Gemmatimonadota bacterium]